VARDRGSLLPATLVNVEPLVRHEPRAGTMSGVPANGYTILNLAGSHDLGKRAIVGRRKETTDLNGQFTASRAGKPEAPRRRFFRSSSLAINCAT
jgi:hypothetical protein